MKIKFREGFLFTSVQISFRGNTKVVENIVVEGCP